ncbi:hypothetical protein GQ44DRAFT_714672 [Phaeosphaeriaceae sp. PMI808]|nr:hypothetical protein GQ44DRAFT_714672 [Phaeosphaeriaceae sp. PMI808]
MLSMKGVKTEIITTTEQVADLVDWLVLCHAPPVPHSPTIYLDLEGVNLCREGSISILTLLIDTGIPTGRVCLIDVHTLGAHAFSTAGAKQKTLQEILEDEKDPKSLLRRSQRFRCPVRAFWRGVARSRGRPAYGECDKEDHII